MNDLTRFFNWPFHAMTEADHELFCDAPKDTLFAYNPDESDEEYKHILIIPSESVIYFGWRDADGIDHSMEFGL